MFSYNLIQKYNETDLAIYKYITSNLDKIPYMTIRELAKEVHTSPAAILRFCQKNDCQGYTEFKKQLKREVILLKASAPSLDLQELVSFFERANSSAFENKLRFAVTALQKAELVLFLGQGSSGTLARYGARYFSNMGKFSLALEDPYYPVNTYTHSNTAVIVLSESGETPKIIEITRQFQEKKCCILSITNSVHSTLAKISDWNFSYHFEHQRVNGDYNATSQVPVLFVIEALARRI